MFLSTFTWSQSNNALFNQANNLYNEGKVQDAISTYEKIIENGYHSTELYFNLGNAYYKLNQIAPSIYFYEKALLLSPNDQDAITNLSFANNMTIDAIEVIPELGLSKITNAVVNKLEFDYWAYISVGMVLLFVVLIILYYFSYSTTRKRITFLLAFTSLFLGVLSLAISFKKFDYDKNNNPAIVFAQESEVKTEPNLRSEGAFELHEGTKVQVLETYDSNWTKIKIADGKTGWISSEDIKAL